MNIRTDMFSPANAVRLDRISVAYLHAIFIDLQYLCTQINIRTDMFGPANALQLDQ